MYAKERGMNSMLELTKVTIDILNWVIFDKCGPEKCNPDGEICSPERQVCGVPVPCTPTEMYGG